jgi:hypothetical protein
MRFTRVALITLSLMVSLVGTAVADIGPKPIRETGIWNDPERFQLLENIVEINLGWDAAEVTACFVFISVHELNYWDKGTLEWVWPLPAAYPMPDQFQVSSYERPVWPEKIEEYRETPCRSHSSYINLETRPVRQEWFEQIGIDHWYVFSNDFLMYMPAPSLLVKAVVSYSQPYKWQIDRVGEITYIFRTGSLWSGPIEHLLLKVHCERGMELVGSSWQLEDGVIELTDVEPESDLMLTVQRMSTGIMELRD